MSIDPHVYNITIRRGNFEGEALYEARVKELPDLAEYGDSADEAYELVIDAIETAAEAFEEQGRHLPPPSVPADEFSGRVTLRLAKSLHRALSLTADEEGVSLNQHLVNVLSYYSGFAAAQKTPDADGPWNTVDSEGKKPRSTRPRLTVVRSDDLKQAM